MPLVTNSMSGCLAPADIELFIPFTQRLVEMNCRFMKLFWAGLWLSLLREQNQIATEFPQLWLVWFCRGRKRKSANHRTQQIITKWNKCFCFKQSLQKAQQTGGLSLQQLKWEHKFLKYSWPNFSSKNSKNPKTLWLEKVRPSNTTPPPHSLPFYTHVHIPLNQSVTLVPSPQISPSSMFHRIDWFQEHQSLFKEEDISG